VSSSEPTAAQVRRASRRGKREAAGLLAWSWDWEHVGIFALAALAVGGSVVVLLESDDQSALEIAIFLVVVALALASVFLTVEARRRRVLAYAQLLRSVAETTVDMHGMIRRFRHQDVDARLLSDARAALVDARELQVLLGRERPEIGELEYVASELQEQFAAAPSPSAATSARPGRPETTP
jgi:hypothetical protein